MTEETTDLDNDSAAGTEETPVEIPETTKPGTTEASQVETSADGQKVARKRAEVSFPKLDLATAIKVAEAVFNEGNRCSAAQLANQLGNTATSGAFIQKVAVGRVFGLIDKKGDAYGLTNLGTRILQPDKAAQAKIESLFSIGVFRDIYTEYKGGLMPPDSTLEKFLVLKGLSSDDAARTRLVFAKSANTAGLYDRDEKRMILPRGTSENGSAGDAGGAYTGDDEDPNKNTRVPQPNLDMIAQRLDELASQIRKTSPLDDLHPAIQGMLATLPRKDSQSRMNWNPKMLDTWATTFTTVLHFVYDVDLKSA